MSLIVRFHALNPTMKAREDVPIPDFSRFNYHIERARKEPDVSGVTLIQVCDCCKNEETVGSVQTQLVRTEEK